MQITANSFLSFLLADHERLQARWRGKMTRRRYIAEQELLGDEVIIEPQMVSRERSDMAQTWTWQYGRLVFGRQESTPNLYTKNFA